MQPKPLYTRFAKLAQQYHNCEKAKNSEWLYKSREAATQLCKTYMPSGSGIDSGTDFDIDASSEFKLVFNTSYHHMDDVGYYDGWTQHQLTVRPNLAQDFDLSISGRDRKGIKEYLHEIYSSALSDEDWHLREEYLSLSEKHPELTITGRWLDGCTQVWEIKSLAHGADFKSFNEALNWLNANNWLDKFKYA